jgi:hypothetical protein
MRFSRRRSRKKESESFELENLSDLVTNSSILMPGHQVCYVLKEETFHEVSKVAVSRTGFYIKRLHILFNLDNQAVVDLHIPDEYSPRKEHIRRFTRRDCCVEIVGDRLPFHAHAKLTPIVKRSGTFYGVPEILEPGQGSIAALG